MFNSFIEVCTFAQDRLPYIAFLIESLKNCFDIELRNIQPRIDLAPIQRSRNSSPRLWSKGIRSREGLSSSVLKKVKIDSFLALGRHPQYTGGIRQNIIYLLGHKLSKVLCDFIIIFSCKRHVNMQTGGSGCFTIAINF